MKTIFTTCALTLCVFFSKAQNTDLPSPTANLQTLPIGSYVIAMDNTNQNNGVYSFNPIVSGLKFNWTNGSAVLTAVTNTTGILVGMGVQSDEASIPSTATVLAVTATTVTLSAPVTASKTNKEVNFGTNDDNFNIKAYGLIVTLLNNNKKVKWIITAGKAKDGTDISVNATRIKPTAGSAAGFNFKAGPFVIFAADTSGVSAIVDAFNSSISNANEKIKIYKTNASVTTDVRYDLSGFIPKAAVLTDGGNEAIHVSYFTNCNIPSGNYTTAAGVDLFTSCVTFASEPHNSKSGPNVDNAIAGIKNFVQSGGNFLAQCEAVMTYENNVNGRFQTTTGITDANSTAGSNISYPNSDLSYSQFEGKYNISKGGSIQNWTIDAASTNNFHDHAHSTADPAVIGASVTKHASGAGGLVFYLGNHRFDDDLSEQSSINGLRMYMNAFLTPVSIDNNCAFATTLPVKLVSYDATLKNTNVELNWTTISEINFNHFEIERSFDGSDYKNISVVFAVGSKEAKTDYAYSDDVTSIEKSVIYYRLKMVDIDGKFKYSDIRVIRLGKETAVLSINTYPNPVVNEVRVMIPSAWQNKEVKYQIFNSNGQVVMTKTNNKASQTEIFNLSNIARGFYIVKASNGIETAQQKIIKY